VSATPPQYQGNRPVLSTSEASARSGLSREYISSLLQTGRIEGIKPGGHDWMIFEDSLMAFLAQPRSKGRKGPRRTRIERNGRILLSTAEAQELTGYARDTLLRLLRAGHIQGEKSGRNWLIYEDSLLAYKRRKHLTIVDSSSGESEEPLSSPPEPSNK